MERSTLLHQINIFVSLDLTMIPNTYYSNYTYIIQQFGTIDSWVGIIFSFYQDLED